MKLKIGPLTVPVRIDPGALEENVMGETRYDGDAHIVLRAAPNTSLMKSTLLHEVLHVLDDQYGLGLGERKIRTLEMALGQTLTDNPQLREALYGPPGTPDSPAAHEAPPSGRERVPVPAVQPRA